MSIFAVSTVSNAGPLPGQQSHELNIVSAASQEEAEKKVKDKLEAGKWFLCLDSILSKEVDILI